MTQTGPRHSPLTLGLKCLRALTAQLTEEDLPKEDLKPLLDLETNVTQHIWGLTSAPDKTSQPID